MFDEYYREQLKLDVYWNHVGGKWREFSLKVLLYETGNYGEKVKKTGEKVETGEDILFKEDLYQVLSSIGESGVDLEAQKAIQQSILDQYKKDEIGSSAQDGRNGSQNSQSDPNWRNMTTFPSLQQNSVATPIESTNQSNTTQSNTNLSPAKFKKMTNKQRKQKLKEEEEENRKKLELEKAKNNKSWRREAAAPKSPAPSSTIQQIQLEQAGRTGKPGGVAKKVQSNSSGLPSNEWNRINSSEKMAQSSNMTTGLKMTSIIEQEAVEIQNKCRLELEKLVRRKHTETEFIVVELLN
jgi:hypothetical protein